MEEFVVCWDVDGTLTDMSKFTMEEGIKYFKCSPVVPEAYGTMEMFNVSKKQEFFF